MNKLNKLETVIFNNKSVFDKIMNTRPSNLFFYLPLNDPIGSTFAKNYAPFRSGLNLECVPNPSFEISGNSPNTFYGWINTLAGGTIQQITGDVYSSTYAAKLTSGGGNTRIQTAVIDNVEGANYTLNIYCHGDGVTAPKLILLEVMGELLLVLILLHLP